MSSEEIIDSMPCSDDLNLDELQFMRVRVPEAVRLIPMELIEHVKGRLFTPEEFYRRQEAQVEHNGDNYLYLLVDSKNKVQGYLWAILEPGHCLWVNTFSMRKAYWKNGAILKKVFCFIENINKKLKCPVIQWCTTNPRFFEKHGLKRSRTVIMEFVF